MSKSKRTKQREAEAHNKAYEESKKPKAKRKLSKTQQRKAAQLLAIGASMSHMSKDGII